MKDDGAAEVVVAAGVLELVDVRVVVVGFAEEAELLDDQAPQELLETGAAVLGLTLVLFEVVQPDQTGAAEVVVIGAGVTTEVVVFHCTQPVVEIAAGV